MFDFVLTFLHIIFGTAIVFVSSLFPAALLVLIAPLILLWTIYTVTKSSLFQVIKETIQKLE